VSFIAGGVFLAAGIALVIVSPSPSTVARRPWRFTF
jgi:hypothetical protein